MTTSQVGARTDTAPSAAPAVPSGVERWLAPLLVGLAVLSALFGVVISPGSPTAMLPAFAAGLAGQLAATAVLARQGARPHLGIIAVTVVALALSVPDSPWRPLVAAEAVPWVAIALAWATVRVVRDARTPRQLRLSAAVAVVYCVAAGTSRAAYHGQPATAVSATISAGVPILCGVCLSLVVRLRQARRDRVTAVYRERAALAQRARSDERQRLAARLHDTLGHALTLLVLHANALAVNAGDPAVRATGEQMSELGRDGVRELRQALELLHDDEPAAPGHLAGRSPAGVTGPPVRLDTVIEPLVAQAISAGQQVRLELHGAEDPVVPALGNTAHRVVQEGLTNARRHALDAPVEVTVSVTTAALDIEVRNGATGCAAVGPGTGRGLSALRHRVILLGGSCEYGWAADGGYALRVHLPMG